MTYMKTIENILSNSLDSLLNVHDSNWFEKPIPEKWSKMEILGHLIDSANNNQRRIILSQDKEDLIFDGYDQDAWVIRNNYQKANSEDLVHLWLLTNEQFVQTLRKLNSERIEKKHTTHNFDKICFNPRSAEDEVNLSYLIWDYIEHMEHHLSQILKNYKKTNSKYL